MRADADDFTVARHFEAYLLWLFGWVMFCSSQGDSCPKQLIPLARSIADAPLHEVPQFSWASAVLAATYRGLCTGVTKVSAEEPIFVGCPLLLQLLWQNHLNYPGSSAQAIIIKATTAQMHFKRNNSWSVG